jgi:GT2 family glycosyltransferase
LQINNKALRRFIVYVSILNKMKIAIAFITYNQDSFKYLPYFLPSLNQTIEIAKNNFGNEVELSVLSFDNSDDFFIDNKNFLTNFFKENNIENKIWSEQGNLGFAKAYNMMLNYSLKNGFDKLIMINPDVLLDEYFLERFIFKFKQYPDVAVLSPLIFYWDFINNKKTDIIDSCGVGLTKSHYFFDIGQGQVFNENIFKEGEIFGFTGAGAGLDLKKISQVAYKKESNYLEFFDELMFMYKEDVELSYRLQLAEMRVLFSPEIKMYHHRALSSLKGKIKDIFFKANPSLGRSRSFLNQLIIFYKIKKLPFSLRVRVSTNFRYFLLIIYGYFFQKKQLRNFRLTKALIERKPLYLKDNIVGMAKIERFMNRS